MVDRMLDFRLIGPLELRWYRHHDSSLSHRTFALGNGCAHEYERSLHADGESLVYEEGAGRFARFPILAADGQECALSGSTLKRIDSGLFHLFRHAQPAMEFRFIPSQRRAPLARLFDGTHEVRFHYDAELRLQRITDSAGRHLRATWDQGGRLLLLEVEPTSSGPGYLLVAYRYDGRGNLIATENSQGHGYAFAYDSGNRMVWRRGRKGFQFHFSYDDQGRCIRAMGDERLHGVALNYKVPGRVTQVTRPDRGVWVYSFTANGDLAEIADPLGGAQKFFRNDAGQQALELDPNGNASTFAHDAAGAVIAKIDSWGRRSVLPEDPNAADPQAHRVAANPAEYEYGRLLSTRRITLPEHSQLQWLELPPWVHAQVTLRPGPPAVASAAFKVRPLGTLWWPEPVHGRLFSDFGKLTEQHDDFGRSRRWIYDASGNLAEYRDFDDRIWSHDYGAWHFLRRLTAPNGASVHYAYTFAGNVSSFTDAGGSISEYGYDTKDQLVEVRRHGVVRERYRRDPAGNLVAKLAADGRELLRIDIGRGNLPAKRVLASGDEHTFQYDASGRPLHASTSKDRIEFAYDEFGNRTADKRNGRGVEHGFTGHHALAHTVFFGRFEVRHELHADGTVVLTDPGQQRHIIRVHGHGLVERTYSNCSREVAQYDAAGRCLFKSLQRRNGRIWNRRFHWSGEGELLRVDDDHHGVVIHEYDSAHRLRRRHAAGQTEEYEFDAADNLLCQPGLADVRLGSGNRLHQANGEAFAYNDRDHVQARLTRTGPVQYHYDSRDQLVRVQMPQGTWEAEYDALGRRTRKHWNGSTTEYYWNTDQLVAECNALGQVRLYLYADVLAMVPLLMLDYASPDASPDSCRRHFIFGDQLGTPYLIEDEQGQEVWRARVTPFGQDARETPGEFQCNLRFPGHYADPELALYYNRFRHYSPTLGRYLQSDPWGISGGYNLYAYPTNPLATTDIRGLGDENDKKCKNKDDEESSATSKKNSSDKPLTPEQLQAAADKIHGVLQDKPGKDFQLTTTAVTQGRDEHGNIVVTVTNSKGRLAPDQREAAVAALGPDVRMPTEPRGAQPDNGHHAEQRGIRATEGQTERQQASSSGAGHGGAACAPCAESQRQAGVENVTGLQPEAGGTGRSIPPPWATPPPG